MLLPEVFSEIIKPNFNFIEKRIREGIPESKISEELGVNRHVWRQCKNRFPDFVSFLESLKGPNSTYHIKVAPFYDKIEEWICGGISERVIASRLDIDVHDFYTFKKVYPEFGEFILRCNAEADGIVEGSMFKNANGYTYEEKKESVEEGEFIYKNGEQVFLTDSSGNFILKDGKKIPKRKPGKIKIEKTTKYQGPNYSAGSFWLINRQKKKWSLRADSNQFINPGEAARAIKESLDEMEQTVPKLPELTPFEQVQEGLRKITKEDALKLKEMLEALLQY